MMPGILCAIFDHKRPTRDQLPLTADRWPLREGENDDTFRWYCERCFEPVVTIRALWVEAPVGVDLVFGAAMHPGRLRVIDHFSYDIHDVVWLG